MKHYTMLYTSNEQEFLNNINELAKEGYEVVSSNFIAIGYSFKFLH